MKGKDRLSFCTGCFNLEQTSLSEVCRGLFSLRIRLNESDYRLPRVGLQRLTLAHQPTGVSIWSPRMAVGNSDTPLVLQSAADPCGIVTPTVRKWPGTRAELSPPRLTLILCLLSEERYMGPTLPPDNEVWDLDRLGLPAEMVGDVSTRRRPPRHRSGHPFIKGPSPYPWIVSACRLPGSGLHFAMACRFLCGRYRRPDRWGLDPPVVAIARAAPRARQGALPTGLHVAVHHLGPLLLRSKEACQATGLGRVRNGQD